MSDLQNPLAMPRGPGRVEAYAISHLEPGQSTLVRVGGSTAEEILASVLRIRNAIYNRGRRTARRYDTRHHEQGGEQWVYVRRTL